MDELQKEISKIIADNNWLVLSTVDEKGKPHSSVVVYQSDGDVIYVKTGKNTLKAKNIELNKDVSITIPFRKNFIHKLVPAPPAELHFTTTASIRPNDDEEALRVYEKYLKYVEKRDFSGDNIWIRIELPNIIATYGVGVSLFKMRDPEKARKIARFK
ncbi:MAG: hypothetical protein BAJALOKI2v1_310028 [Promethearchaeota archaeon]|nr:MAG: hypothetical protein BAJALOKI2v1_310028 [Candidatus Lokiarchaeota archaeon]